MKNMDMGLKVPKWVMINRPIIPKVPQYLSAQIVCPSPKAWDFKKGLHWASIVRGKHITTEAERVIQYNKRKKKHERRNGFWDKCIRSSSNRILS